MTEGVLTAIALVGILAIALGMRTTNVNWDYGQHLHPDERFLSMVEGSIKSPDSIGQYFDTHESALNPYRTYSTFVYGTFPLFLNKAVSSWLTADAKDLPRRWTSDCLQIVTKLDGPKACASDLRVLTGGAARDALEFVGYDVESPDGRPRFDDGYNSNVVGRVLSAIFDVLTVALVFELGRVAFNRRVGLLAAGLLAFTTLHLQYSHFFGSETFLAFFVTAVIYFSIRIVKYGSLWNYVWAGVAFGLVLATKLSGIPVLLVVALAVLIRVWPQIEALAERYFGPLPWSKERKTELSVPALARVVAGGLVFLIATGLLFRVFQPYAFDSRGFFDVFDVTLDVRRDVFSLDGLTHLEPINPTNYFHFSDKFRADINALRNLQTGQDFPPNMQWIARPKIVFPLRNLVLWGMGTPLALAAIAGTGYSGWRVLRRRDIRGLLPAFWSVFFFLFIARGFTPTMRYFIIVYPAMVLLAAWTLSELWEYASSPAARALLARRLPSLSAHIPVLIRVVVAVAVAGAVFWGLAFMGVYRQDISRVQATRWIVDNIPAGSVITSNEWDDGLPLGLPGVAQRGYKGVSLKPYAQDSPEKVGEFVAGLDQADYVIESSNRVYDSVVRVPARFPSMTLYYQHLFDETLGFEKVAEFHNYPRLFGIDIPDQSAEEAFSVYDHPKVTVWRKTPAYSHDRALALLKPELAATAVVVRPAEAATNALLLRPDDLETQREGGTWTDVFGGRLAEDYPTLLWFLVLQAAALAVTPVTVLFFRRLPDRGYLLAKPLGVIVLAYPVWLAASLKVFHFTQTTIAVWLIVMLVAGAVVAFRTRVDLRERLWSARTAIVAGELLFLAAFLLFYFFRLQNPDIWHPFRGGEKPMDMAYLTAVTRSTTMPPYDPWFAGGYINYYYGGQFLTATLSKLTGIVPEVAFNLAVPTFFALTVVGAFSIAHNLASAAASSMRRRPGWRPIPGWSPVAAGVLGAMFVAVIGNLDSVGEMVDRLTVVSHWRPHTELPIVHTTIPGLDPLLSSLGGLWQVIFHGAELQRFDYWRPSRVLPPSISITEFPYFSFLFADLHAHMMSIPFSVLSIGGNLGLALTPVAGRRPWRPWAIVALLGLVVGSLRWLNSWDYPPFLLLALAAVVISERRLEGGALEASIRAAGKALVLVGLSMLLYWPFISNYDQPVSGLVSSPETTPLHQYLVQFGLFGTAVGGWLLFLLVRAMKSSPAGHLVARGPAGVFGRYRRMSASDQTWLTALVVAALVLLALVVKLTMDGLTLMAAITPSLAVVAYLAWRELSRPRAGSGVRLFALSMLGLAFGMSLGVDLLTTKGDITRMNTVFKFWLHIWVVFAIAASFAVWYLLVAVSRARAPHDAGEASVWPRVFGVGVTLLVLAGLIYPVLATPVRLDERFAGLADTLDGMAYMRASVYNDPKGTIRLESDYQGIKWLRENVQGSPAIVEGRTPDLYRWSGRFSIYTGLPTVVGWDWHQRQQRGKFAPMVERRGKEVDQFYNDPDPKQALKFLSRYDVKYVILGQLEKLYYHPEGLVKFEGGLDGVLEIAYENPDLTIYRVKLDAYELALQALP